MAAEPTKKRRPLRRRLLFLAIALLFVAFVIELAGALTWWGMTGEFFTFAGADAQRAAARGEITGDGDQADQQQKQRAANSGTVVHPFFGFVVDGTDGEVAGEAVTRYGFMDDGTPLQQRSDDVFVVALTGGSVALQLGLYAEDVLVAELQKSPLVAGRRVEVVRLAIGGWKQPQQLFALQLAWLRGGEFDLVINLDGFNEVALVPENFNVSVPAWYPRGWNRLLDRTPSRDQLLRLGHLVAQREARKQAAELAGGTWFSPTLQCLWLAGDRRKAAAIAELQQQIESAPTEQSFAIQGPGNEGRDVDASRAEMVEVWRRASIELRALCELHGTHYFHFLQPNQYVAGSKPIGPDEAKIALSSDDKLMAPSVRHAYPLLRAAGKQLQQQGVAFTDLTMVFADHAEPLYVDTCCHVGRRGYEILATAIVARIRQALDLRGFEATGLRCEPTELQLDSPAGAVPLRVLAVDAEAREVDVSSRRFGTRLTASPANLLEISDSGAVRALRRGTGELLIAFGGRELRVPVRADWSATLVVDDGQAPAEGQAPVLRAVGGPDELLLSCSGLPVGPFRLLAASSSPLPAKIRRGQESFGVATTLLAGEGEAVQVASPVAPTADAPLFLRVYAVDAASAEVLATSNTLVVTRR